MAEQRKSITEEGIIPPLGLLDPRAEMNFPRSGGERR